MLFDEYHWYYKELTKEERSIADELYYNGDGLQYWSVAMHAGFIVYMVFVWPINYVLKE